MSKAENLSKQYKDFREHCGIKDPVMLNEIEVAYEEGYHQAEEDLSDKAKVSSGWDGFYYGQGYKQAEKDNELTWEDLRLLQDISHEVFAEVAKGSVDYYQIYPNEQSFLNEILKRFKERKEI